MVGPAASRFVGVGTGAEGWQFPFASVSFRKSHGYIKSWVLVIFHVVCIDLSQSGFPDHFGGGQWEGGGGGGEV